MRLEVDPAGYDDAAGALLSANESVAAGYGRLVGALGGLSAMAGDDKASEDFATGYDEAARAAVDGCAALVEALRNVAATAATSGANHREANEGSVYGTSRDPGGSRTSGDDGASVSPSTPPSSLGGDDPDVPEFWNIVLDYLEGYAWPGADCGALRDAAGAWRAMAGTVRGVSGRTTSASALLGAQRSPEVEVAQQVLRELGTHADDLATQLDGLAEACEGFATSVEETRETVRDLMRDLVIEAGVTAAISGVASFFTFGGAAAVGAGAIAARAAVYAHRIVSALRALKHVRHVAQVADKAREATRITRALDKLQNARSLMKARQALRSMPTRPRKPLDMTPKQLQKKYKHGHDLDPSIPRNYNPQNAEAFRTRLDDFLRDPAVSTRDGLYRGEPAVFNVNPTTGQMVMQKPDGTLWSVWNLSPRQLMHVIRDGRLGGG